jgi:hypothetical protein
MIWSFMRTDGIRNPVGIMTKAKDRVARVEIEIETSNLQEVFGEETFQFCFTLNDEGFS